MTIIANKLRDFSDQSIYVGMDVHHKSWKIHIYSDEFELKSPAGARMIVNYIAGAGVFSG